jgi:hypothetical protein
MHEGGHALRKQRCITSLLKWLSWKARIAALNAVRQCMSWLSPQCAEDMHG